MQKILILLAAAADDKFTAEGQALLRDFRVSYQLRVAAAQVAPDYVREIVTNFHKDGGRLILCVAPAQDRLASLVSSLVVLPVLHVVAQEGTATLDQLPGPIPTFGHGFIHAAHFALQVLALHDPELSQNLQRHRHSLAARMIAADQKHQVIFDA
ncbi:AIR carboxylase family protein [Oligoflexus tunisiensis]|uniref:AIR carboxylase family protein n=1 Tax=Oligoflexus tunisiensis TaxID=708132 RepID=UPI00159F1941|nr:AIR carboxylase family protein [Oligoflexus tunisiensis]